MGFACQREGFSKEQFHRLLSKASFSIIFWTTRGFSYWEVKLSVCARIFAAVRMDSFEMSVTNTDCQYPGCVYAASVYTYPYCHEHEELSPHYRRTASPVTKTPPHQHINDLNKGGKAKSASLSDELIESGTISWRPWFMALVQHCQAPAPPAICLSNMVPTLTKIMIVLLCLWQPPMKFDSFGCHLI